VSGSPALGLIAALAVTLGFCALAFWLLRRIQGAQSMPGRGVPLRVLQRTSLGPRQGVAVLQVGSRVLLVSVGDTGASLLTELEGDERDRAMSAAAPISFTRPKGLVVPRTELHGLWDLARRMFTRHGGAAGLILALVLAPAHSHAQATTSPTTASAQPASRKLSPPPVTVPGPAKGPVTRVAAAPPSRIPGPVVTPPPMPNVDIRIGEGPGQIKLSGAVGLVVFLSVLTLLPAMFLLMTSFTRILIVLHFLRSALGTQTTPPSQLLAALAVLLTGVVMHPVLEETNRVALQPYFQGHVQQAEAYTLALGPFREFMLRNVREQDLATFAEMSGIDEIESDKDLPIVVIVSAFVISELRTSFQMGFVIYLPFVVVDVIVASVLMSLGMFMLPPVMISMPLKLLLFVLADGWTLVVQNLAASFK